MNFFRRMSPVRAYQDLRFFLASREPHELWFLVASLAITGFFIYGFAHDSYAVPAYKPDIIYVKQWRLDRTEAQILADQKTDQAQKDKDQAALRKRQEAVRAEFKRVDDSLTKLGI